MAGTLRGWIRFTLVFVLFVAGTSALLVYYYPSPPSRIRIATGVKGASYFHYGNRYKERLESFGLTVDVRETLGAVENLELLQDPNSGVDVAFVSGGVSNSSRAPNVISLGIVYVQPLWIFYVSDETFLTLGQLKGKRISVGPNGSGTRLAALSVLEKAGVNPKTSEMLPLYGNEAVKALDEGKVDAVWLSSAPNASAVQALLRNQKVKVMSFPTAEAFTRIMPELVRITLPQGVIDMERNIPAQDVSLLAIPAKIIVRKDIHPEIVHPLLRTMISEHGAPDIFQKSGEFPKLTDTEYPMSDIAVEYYKNGPTFLQRHLPLQLTIHAQRLTALCLATIPFLLFVISYEPLLYRWIIRERVRPFYSRLKVIERQLPNELTVEQIIYLAEELEEIDRKAIPIKIPLRHSNSFFSLKVHINLIRTRLGARLAEARAKLKRAHEVV